MRGNTQSDVDGHAFRVKMKKKGISFLALASSPLRETRCECVCVCVYVLFVCREAGQR